MTTKPVHEIRDPVHAFIRLESAERDVLNSRPFQRLRYIHQLATTYLLYPGATHRRFEHSLGVMELATRIYDTVTREDNIDPRIRDILGEILHQDALARPYWRRVLRMAALCHDVGHLPFSHAGEKQLLPDGWDHERLTVELIMSPEMCAIWNAMEPKPDPEQIARLATGQQAPAEVKSRLWQSILGEIIVGDAFGADRMDYLLRDSLHTGVAYGHFDHHRLIDTLRILPEPLEDSAANEEGAPTLGIDEGGIHTAEALVVARYFMYQQVYFHHIRRIYDIHLIDFLKEWVPNRRYPTGLEQHLRITDNTVLAAIQDAAIDQHLPGHDAARRIMMRDHFHRLYQRNPQDIAVNPDAARSVYDALSQQFGEQLFRLDSLPKKDTPPLSFGFPVRLHDDAVVKASMLSSILLDPPPTTYDYVFVDPVVQEGATKWLGSHRRSIIAPKEKE